MKADILDTFIEEGNKCFLSSITLADYVQALPEDYDTYEVQREIVKNAYLDDLITTILKIRHIPPIVLVVEDGNFQKDQNHLTIGEFKILDGLQRTFRLRAIFKTIQFLKEELQKGNEILEFSRLKLSREYKEKLDEINSSTSSLNKIIEHFKTDLDSDETRLDALFDRKQWYEIWTGLTADQEVTKMLILNAGHKPVKTKHQLELLFRGILKTLSKVEFQQFIVIREKEKSSIRFSKERQTGEFHFSHLITSLLSLGEGKPLTSNVQLIQKSQKNYFDEEVFDRYLKLDFIKQFVRFLLNLDTSLLHQYDELGLRWLGRETSLVGIFAALGKYINESRGSATKALEVLSEKIIIHPEALRLDDFESKRSNLNLAKINIGNVNKKAVYNGVYDILIGKSERIEWSEYFKGLE